MFFILSKVLLILTQPAFWVFVLFIWALLTKNAKRKKHLLWWTVGVFYFFSNPYILKQYTRMWDVPSETAGNTNYNCAIVLGGFTSVDDNGNGYFNGSSTRFIAALKLLATGKASKLMITGGSGLLLKGHDFKEADFTLQQLHLLKIPDSVILTENRSRNTMENALFSKKVLLDNKVPSPYLLVTSAFHMRRSLYTFKKAGMDVIAYPSDYAAQTSEFDITDLAPNAYTLALWDTYTKELVGYVAYHFKSFH